MQVPNEMFIDGEWVPASDGARREIINPATEEPVDTVPVATAADLDKALEAADRGWREWREVDAWTRSAALRRIYGRVIDGHSRAHRLLVMRQPIGPVAAFSPWNFPMLLSSRKIAPALAAGCSIIVKPAIEAPRTSLCLAQACRDAGIPPGVVNVVTGDSSRISRHLILSPIIRKVSLTGSVDEKERRR